MTGPLAGVRVLEVAMYGFVPSCGAVLGEWGAEVVKVEHAVTGDPQRGLRQTGPLRVEGDPNPNFDNANRGKRSIGLDMSVPEGREVLYELARRSDVFLTSFLPGHRKKFGIDVEDIRAVNPAIIYARGSAFGPRGQESEKGGYDMTAFWCRAGTAATITPPGIEGMIGPPGPAYGDTISGTNLAGGIAAALFKRERTGEPSVVDVSLLGSGLWAMGHTIALTQHLHERLVAPVPGVHGSPINPLVGLYETADGRYISFVMMQPGKFWADVCRHMDIAEYVDDPRFASIEQIAAHTADAVEILGKAMATRTLDGVVGSLRHAGRTVGAGAGHVAGRGRRPGAGQRVPGPGGGVGAGDQPGAVRRGRSRDHARPGLRRADRRDPRRARTGLGPDHRTQDRRRGHLGSAGDLMPHLTVSGTQSPALHCDPRRIVGGVPDHVTPAFRTSPGLLAGRYLHTISAKCGRVSIALVGNGSQALPNSRTRPGVERMPAGPEHSDHRSGCSAADLTVPEGNLAARGHVATWRPNEDMTESTGNESCRAKCDQHGTSCVR